MWDDRGDRKSFLIGNADPFCEYSKRKLISLKIRTKMGRSIKDKMCVLAIYFVCFAFIIHRLKISGFPMKSVFMFRIKGAMKKGGVLLSHNLRDTLFISLKMRKKGRGNKKCLRASRPIINYR